MIVLLTRKYPPSIGGMQRWSAELGRALMAAAPRAASGGRPAVAVWAPPAFAARGPAGLTVLALAARSALSAFRLGESPTETGASGRVRLVHLGDGALAPLGPLLRRCLGCAVTATVHGLDVTYDAAWYRRLVPAALRRLDAVVSVSQATASACAARGVPVRAIITNGVDVRAWATLPTRRLARAALGLGDGIWLLSVGRLVRRKGLDWFAAEVVPELVGRDGPPRLLVVGDGPERERVAATARVAGVADRVRLLGAVSEDALRMAYAAADVFVMPNVPVASNPEGFGLVALEAAAAGLPVVAAAIDGIPDAVADGVTGRLLPARGAKAWIAELNELLREPALRGRLGAAARRSAQAERDWSLVATAYWKLFEDVLAEAGGDRAAGAAPPGLVAPAGRLGSDRS